MHVWRGRGRPARMCGGGGAGHHACVEGAGEAACTITSVWCLKVCISSCRQSSWLKKEHHHTWFTPPTITPGSLHPPSHLLHSTYHHTCFTPPTITPASLHLPSHLVHSTHHHTCFTPPTITPPSLHPPSHLLHSTHHYAQETARPHNSVAELAAAVSRIHAALSMLNCIYA